MDEKEIKAQILVELPEMLDKYTEFDNAATRGICQFCLRDRLIYSEGRPLHSTIEHRPDCLGQRLLAWANKEEVDPMACVDVDGHIDERGIRYLGKAYRADDGTYRVMADVHGKLCIVEATIKKL